MSDTFHHGIRRQRQLFGEHLEKSHWMRNEPTWYTTAFKHRKRRAELQRSLSKFLHGYVNIVWPLDRKPREYYW